MYLVMINATDPMGECTVYCEEKVMINIELKQQTVLSFVTMTWLQNQALLQLHQVFVLISLACITCLIKLTTITYFSEVENELYK